MYDITVIGAAILDVLAHPVSPSNLNSRSWPAEGVSMTVGGDAANEATILARLGKKSKPDHQAGRRHGRTPAPVAL